MSNLGFIRITVSGPKAQGSGMRHGGIRMVSDEMADELWAGWEGLLDRLQAIDTLPDTFKIAEEP